MQRNSKLHTHMPTHGKHVTPSRLSSYLIIPHTVCDIIRRWMGWNHQIMTTRGRIVVLVPLSQWVLHPSTRCLQIVLITSAPGPANPMDLDRYYRSFLSITWCMIHDTWYIPHRRPHTTILHPAHTPYTPHILPSSQASAFSFMYEILTDALVMIWWWLMRWGLNSPSIFDY